MFTGDSFFCIPAAKQKKILDSPSSPFVRQILQLPATHSALLKKLKLRIRKRAYKTTSGISTGQKSQYYVHQGKRLGNISEVISVVAICRSSGRMLLLISLYSVQEIWFTQNRVNVITIQFKIDNPLPPVRHIYNLFRISSFSKREFQETFGYGFILNTISTNYAWYFFLLFLSQFGLWKLLVQLDLCYC